MRRGQGTPGRFAGVAIRNGGGIAGDLLIDAAADPADAEIGGGEEQRAAAVRIRRVANVPLPSSNIIVVSDGGM